ncbi:MAG: protease inhibitor I42 family protein [Geminicoccaceae bacterium]
MDLLLTEDDAGRTVEVAPAASVRLRLPENPTTGYRWMLTMQPAGCLELASDGFERPSAAMPGAGGVRVLEINAMPLSPCELTLASRRPWEAEGAPASELTYRFVRTP